MTIEIRDENTIDGWFVRAYYRDGEVIMRTATKGDTFRMRSYLYDFSVDLPRELFLEVAKKELNDLRYY